MDIAILMSNIMYVAMETIVVSKMAVRETVKSKLQSNLNDFSALTR